MTFKNLDAIKPEPSLRLDTAKGDKMIFCNMGELTV